MNIGLLHPGEMGTSVGEALQAGGARVFWASEFRSAATRVRATRAGFRELPTLVDLCRQCQAIVSVLPPDACADVATQVLAANFRGVYLDASAKAPDQSRQTARALRREGIDFVDGAIIGPPIRAGSITQLYLAGSRAGEVAHWFAGSGFRTQVMGGQPGTASALKQCDSIVNKAFLALLYQGLELAERQGVRAQLLAHWSRDAGSAVSVALAHQRLRRSAPKAPRFAAEMADIARTLQALQLPDASATAAQHLFQRLAVELDAVDAGGDAPLLKAAGWPGADDRGQAQSAGQQGSQGSADPA